MASTPSLSEGFYREVMEHTDDVLDKMANVGPIRRLSEDELEKGMHAACDIDKYVTIFVRDALGHHQERTGVELAALNRGVQTASGKHPEMRLRIETPPVQSPLMTSEQLVTARGDSVLLNVGLHIVSDPSDPRFSFGSITVVTADGSYQPKGTRLTVDDDTKSVSIDGREDRSEGAYFKSTLSVDPSSEQFEARLRNLVHLPSIHVRDLPGLDETEARRLALMCPELMVRSAGEMVDRTARLGPIPRQVRSVSDALGFFSARLQWWLAQDSKISFTDV